VSVIDLYSKRKKRQESQGQTEVYRYDAIPQGLRIQIAKIWMAAIGCWRRSDTPFVTTSPSSEWWEFIEKTIAKEKQVWHLGEQHSDQATRCIQYLITTDTEGALDIIELSFRALDRCIRKFSPSMQEIAGISQSADDAIEELNIRFREHGVGYQYVDGDIIRVDSQLIHAEVVKPALSLLNNAGFSGPSDEFMRAFDHYRKGEKKDAIADALSALESTMKAICDSRGWRYGPKDTAAPLIDVLLKNGLIPPPLLSHFGGLRAALESGLPAVANPNRHGQGSTPIDVPEHYVAYALHLAASDIVFLLQCHKHFK